MKLVTLFPLVILLSFPGALPVQAYPETEQILDLIERLGSVCDKIPLDEPFKYDNCVDEQLEQKLGRNLFELESTPN
jgi:hypothetical protein